MGTADLRASFGSKRHELVVSTQQMCVLMLFNDRERLSYKDIADASEIPGPELKRALQSLACVKGRNVLRKEPMSKDVADTDEFVFNDKFTSKLFKVKISTVAATKEGEVEKAETRHKVEGDRKHQIEAAIVRIMKARKVGAGVLVGSRLLGVLVLVGRGAVQRAALFIGLGGVVGTSLFRGPWLARQGYVMDIVEEESGRTLASCPQLQLRVSWHPM